MTPGTQGPERGDVTVRGEGQADDATTGGSG
jgi:hypothetical protein